LLGALGCGAESKDLRRDLEAMRNEMQTMRQENGELARRVDALSARLDAQVARAKRGSAESAGSIAPAGAGPATVGKSAAASPAPAAEPSVPPNLAVIKIGPPRKGTLEGTRPRRAAPPVPTTVPIREPDGGVLATLGSPRRDLAAEAQADLDAAHGQPGLAAARALEAFAGRYPHHPSADNALLEAAQLRADADDLDTACDLYERCVREYPAGDAMPDALERLAGCYARKGQKERARPLLERVMKDYPQTPAAKRAAQRLAETSEGNATPATPIQQGAAP
jgi:TolA-binding protein